MIGTVGKWLGRMVPISALAKLMLVASAAATAGELLPSGIMRDTWQVQGTITGHTVNYSVLYQPNQTNMPVFLHQYGQESMQTGVEGVNERVAGYGVLSVFVSLGDSHCGYELQDYKDAIDDVFHRYAARINTKNVTIAGESYGGAVTYGMATHFPHLFDAVIPIFGVADFGYDETQSWYPMIVQNSPTWGVPNEMNQHIGDRATYRDTRYLVRNAVFAAKNNPYAHFEILHDADDGVNKSGVQVQQSRRYVAELDRLGYTNYHYTETPNSDVVYPSDSSFDSSLWGQQIRYTHGFWNTSNASLYEFELNTLKPNMLHGDWKRPSFATTGDLFIPSFLESPYFRFDLGSVANNCAEAADVSYDVSSPDKFTFQIIPQTELTVGKLRLLKLTPDSQYGVTCTLADTGDLLTAINMETDAAGSLVFDIPDVAKGSTLIVECARVIPEPNILVIMVIGVIILATYACWRYRKQI